MRQRSSSACGWPRTGGVSSSNSELASSGLPNSSQPSAARRWRWSGIETSFTQLLICRWCRDLSFFSERIERGALLPADTFVAEEKVERRPFIHFAFGQGGQYGSPPPIDDRVLCCCSQGRSA